MYIKYINIYIYIHRHINPPLLAARGGCGGLFWRGRAASPARRLESGLNSLSLSIYTYI